jgi:hypothetical protein
MLKSGRKTSIWQGLQIIFILSGNVYMYLYCNVKKNKTTAKLSKKKKTNVVLIVFDGVL